jgi:DNA-binding MarR family transcriptional regulator
MTTTPDSAALELADRLHSASIRLLRQLRRLDEESGVTAPHLSALSVLVFAGERTLGELAAAEGVRPPSMTRIVQNLERDGLVAREEDPADRRISRVRATPRGEALLQEGRARRVAALAERVAELPAPDRALLEAAAAVLNRMLTQGGVAARRIR